MPPQAHKVVDKVCTTKSSSRVHVVAKIDFSGHDYKCNWPPRQMSVREKCKTVFMLPQRWPWPMLRATLVCNVSYAGSPVLQNMDDDCDDKIVQHSNPSPMVLHDCSPGQRHKLKLLHDYIVASRCVRQGRVFQDNILLLHATDSWWDRCSEVNANTFCSV